MLSLYLTKETNNNNASTIKDYWREQGGDIGKTGGEKKEKGGVILLYFNKNIN